MTVTVRKLSTNDMLIFDGRTYESYVVKPDRPCKPSDDPIALAKEWVANGHGVHLLRSHLNQLQLATHHIPLFT